MEFEYTTSWFMHNRPAWVQICNLLKPRRFLEIGSFEGQSACFVIEAMGAMQPVDVVCIDTWQGGVEHDKSGMGEVEARFDRNIQLATSRSAHPVSVLKKKKLSLDALAELLVAGQGGTFDLIYVDGSHQAADVLADAVLAFRLLRLGGVVIFDDYAWSRQEEGQEDLLDEPKIAIDSFVNVYRRKLRILLDMPLRQLYAVKLSD
ncbi:MAG TPA: class I SAM-dependent methyltransferase [Rhodocyclaceae bacterium]|nr:class I SAM-dependent methyltransferase [Rhodocyclaceae bacterium]